MAAHANQAPEPIHRRRPDTPRYLADLVMRCLAKSPADRPQHAREVAAALRDQRISGARNAHGAWLTRLPTWVPWAIAALATALAIYFGVRR
jgi:hypothetical protein